MAQLNPEYSWPSNKEPTKRQLEKLAVAEEIRALRENIMQCHNKIPQRVVNGSYDTAVRFKENHEHNISKATQHEYSSASYSLNDLTKKRDMLTLMLRDIS